MQEGDVNSKLQEIGCCQLCILRFTGEKSPAAFGKLYTTLSEKATNTKEIPQDGPQNKQKKVNPCTACLGLLQKPFCDGIMEKVYRILEGLNYDSDTFNIALTFPVCVLLRAHSLYLYLEAEFPNFVKNMFPLGLVTVGVKDVWKWIYTPLIGEKLAKTYDPSSGLTITLSISYKDEEPECSVLYKMFPDTFSKAKNLKNTGSKDTFSRKSAEACLKVVNPRKFTTNCQVPPGIPTVEAVCGDLTTHHESLYIAGRYNKLSRNLPQTPWIINGERKLEDSVEEIISVPLKKAVISEETKFSSSGREDVDVRTLGRGRPFSVELLNPRRSKVSDEEMRQVEADINSGSGGRVFVRDLQFVFKSSLDILKSGEETKEKEYKALCLLVERERWEACCQELSELSSRCPIRIKQATPIRVLHRRPVAVRDRTIHWIEATPLSSDPEKEDYFTLKLCTQAGTYIKEFIHGDFGRTKPSLKELLGGMEVDIVALDVENISLDWPPEIAYNKKSEGEKSETESKAKNTEEMTTEEDDGAEGGSTEGGSTEGGSTEGGSTEGGSTEGGSTEGGSTEVLPT